MELLRPLIDTQFGAKSVAYTGTAGNTGTWPAGPQGVLVWCTTDAYVSVGENSTATTTDIPIPAYTAVPIYVPQPGDPNTGGGAWRVSAVQVSAGGTLYAKPINIR